MHGYTDTPIELAEQDVMNVKVYTESLSEFILTCSTPMTIAIQGDWGSGKTSMMNMIRNEIESQIVPVWFNTWQYSQFEMASYLSVSLLSNFLEKIGADKESQDFLKGLTRGLSSFGKTAAVAVTEQLVGGTIASNLKDKLTENVAPQDSSKILEELRAKIGKAVNAKLAASKKERIVIFVNDLDRLAPEKAVELLEVLKIFMDVPQCVFVLAVDYGVVTLGLEKKFGVTVGHAKGKSFFDKIIQLPFSIPIAQYDISGFIKNLLSNMGIACAEEEITAYRDVVDLSIGCNPRSMKRLFNSFILLNTVARKKGLFNNNEGEDIQAQDTQMILFATLCLQMAFSELYDYMMKNRNDLDFEFFVSMRDLEAIKTNPAFEELRTNLPDKDNLYYKKIVRFMDVFFKCIKKDDDIEMLSESELENFLNTLSFSAITANTHEDVRADKTQVIGNIQRFNDLDSKLTQLSNDGVSENALKFYKLLFDLLSEAAKTRDYIRIHHAKTLASVGDMRLKDGKGRNVMYVDNPVKKTGGFWLIVSEEGGSLEIYKEICDMLDQNTTKSIDFIKDTWVRFTPSLVKEVGEEQYFKILEKTVNVFVNTLSNKDFR